VSAFQRELIDLAPVVRAYALIVTRQSANDADDLVQDTLEKAWKARDQFQPGTSMKAWLFTILRNSQHNEWRRSRRMVEDPNGDYAASLRSEPVQGWRIEFADVLAAIERLDPDSRQALLLITAGLSYEETAAVCDSPLRTVQSRVRRARLRLAEELEAGPVRTPAPRLAAAGGR
jgi:RNA polymerase sigma-70 factor (ECF subfamily)